MPDANTIAIGAYQNDGNGSQSGHVRIYKLKGISGLIYNDINQDCIADNNEVGIEGRNAIIQPGNIIVQTNEEGYWIVDSLVSGMYSITVDTSGKWLATCPTTQYFTITNPDSCYFTSSFGFISTAPCPIPDISINMPFMRPGFSNQKIYVQASNTYHATGALNNAYVEISLDSLITLDSASLSYTALGNNTFNFNLDTINPGQCISFDISATVSSAAVIGQTLCLEAKLLPVDSCALDTIPNTPPLGVSPCSLPWDKSSIEVDGWCQNDSIFFTITNTGDTPEGDMQCYSAVRLYIDGQYIWLDSVLLAGGGTDTLVFLGDGRTWRLEVDQHPLHPGNSHPNATVELCGDSSNWTSNLVNILPHNDLDPVVDIYCGTVTGSFDPNDKMGQPLGVTSNHFVAPNQKIDYLIRFQNTGNDTAFTVIVRDTLDTNLNIFSVREGSSSHNYTFRMYGPRVLEWRFDVILLPDSTTNYEGSNGFVSFSVEQERDLPNSTEINNSASIYFDYNSPVITNSTSHIIDSSVYMAGWTEEKNIIATACNKYICNGLSYHNSGTYWQVISGVGGIDTLLTINLSINNTESTITPSVCDSYISPSGNYTWTSSGVYMDTIPNTIGCDSIITVNLSINNTESTISPNVCDSYTSPSGNNTWTATGTYTDTIPNAVGCDSVITVNLTINNTESTISPYVCDSYTSPSGNYNWTTTGIYTDTIPNAIGCDSIITVDLTIKNSSTTTISPNTCDSYISPSGQLWTITGVYYDTIPNISGCDSIISVDLTIKNSSTNTIFPIICDNYFSPSGNYIWTTSGTYKDTIPNTAGCDSVITVNLTVNNSTTATISPVSCSRYTSPSGNYIWTTTGTYMDTISNTVGCDSVITVNLTVYNVDATVTNTSPTLVANAIPATYQWLDCNNAMAIMNGETNQSYTATANGSYAVEVTQNGCVDTSACELVNNIGIQQNDFGNSLHYYPNPTDGNLVIDLSEAYPNIVIIIRNEMGQEVRREAFDNLSQLQISILGAAGVYYLEVITESKKAILKVIKE
jgi:uncharacterized repeat protein (TIGR01451 family)